MSPKESIKSDPARWPALVGGGLLNVALGTYYAWSVFVPALEREFGWTRTQTSLVATIDMVMLASSFLLAGFLQNRIGPRAVATIGGLLFSAGLFLASYTQSLTTLYLTWGVMVGVGLGFGYLAPITVGSKWFPNHRGLVNGLAIGMFAAGSGIFGPIAAVLVERYGWRTTFQILAGLFLLFTMVGAYMLKDPPEGYAAAGDASTAPTGQGAPHRRADLADAGMPMFYALWLAYALGTTAGTMVISQLVPFARASGFSAASAAFAITIGAVGSASGRFLSGWMSDHFGRLFTLRGDHRPVDDRDAVALRRSASSRALLHAAVLRLLLLRHAAVGLHRAGRRLLRPEVLATNYGVLLLAWGFAGVLGPLIGSRVFVSTGTYQYAFFGVGRARAAWRWRCWRSSGRRRRDTSRQPAQHEAVDVRVRADDPY